MNYRPKSFLIEELVSPAIFKARGDRAWELLDVDALATLQRLRDRFGPLTVNNWHGGGPYSESGLRDMGTKTGAVYSQHKFGRAFDCKFRNSTSQEVGEYVLAHPGDFPLLTVIEDTRHTPTWFHFDTRMHDRNGIWVVQP
jgi:hypothetical protein